MSKPVWLAVGAVVLVIGGYASLRILSNSSQIPPGDDAGTLNPEPHAGHGHPADAGHSTSTGSSIPSNPAGTSAEAPPAVESEQMTPQALIAYAEKLAPKMEEAEKDIGRAREFFAELEGCVQGNDQKSPTIQALCLSTAEELADIHPELTDRYKSLYGSTPPQVLKVIEDSETLDH